MCKDVNAGCSVDDVPADLDQLRALGINAVDVFEALGFAVALLDEGGVIVAANVAWRALPGDAGVGARLLDQHRADGDLDLVLAEGLERVLAARTSRFDIEYQADGRWYLFVASQVAGSGGAVVGVVDVTAQHDVREILDDTAHRDSLTGLPNRRAIRTTLDGAIRSGQRDGTRVAVVFLDLNGFKAVNDGLGHEAGDEVLAAVGRRLAGTIRRDDVLGRWGGDEFVVVVSSEEEHAVPALAARLHDALAQPVAIRGRRTVELGLAIGAAEVRKGEGVDEVISRADEAMFEAKRTGRDLVLAPPPPGEAPG